MGKPPTYLERTLAKGSAVWQALRLVQDNWQNVFTGLGTSRDKSTYGRFYSLSEIPETELTALYHQDDTAKRLVNFKPREMMRQGYVINVDEDQDASSAVGQKIRDMRADQEILDAMIWGRLYGGAAVLLGADDGQTADKPLREESIKSVRWLHVIDKRYLIPETYYADPLQDEFFGEPETYRVVPRRSTPSVSNLVVHRSRLLIFGGAHTSDEERDRLGGWDQSVLNAVYTVLRSFNSVWQSADNLMADASQGVFKIAGLMSMIAGGQKEELQTRMQLVDMSRSVARSLLLDADNGEDFKREGASFTDAANMLDKFMLRLAAAAEIPVTILMGMAPAGLNATGASDIRWFYDTCRTSQKNELRPQLEKLVRILFLAKDGPTGGAEPETWEIRFNPLWQSTPKEQAELEKLTADKDKLYVDAEVLLPEEVALSRFRPEGWSSETQIDREVREDVLEAELEKLEAEAEKADPMADPAMRAAQAAPLPGELAANMQAPGEPPPGAPPEAADGETKPETSPSAPVAADESEDEDETE